MHTYQHLVHYYETDQMGVVHHSNYIRWFEEARTAFFDELGYPYSQVEAAGIIIPVLGVEAKYRIMVGYGDQVTIKTSLASYNGVKLAFNYEVYSASGELTTTGSSQHCFLEADSHKPLKLSRSHPAIHQLLQSLYDDQQGGNE